MKSLKGDWQRKIYRQWKIYRLKNGDWLQVFLVPVPLFQPIPFDNRIPQMKPGHEAFETGRFQAVCADCSRGLPARPVISAAATLMQRPAMFVQSACLTFSGLLLIVLMSGCMESLENQTKKSKNSIIGKKTQEIGQFDPNAGKVVSDSKIHATDPFTAPTSAYGPMLERISKSHIEHAVRLFEAENGQYPKDYDEFMEKIIRANKIELPVLPGGKKYEYDEVNHTLVVVDGPAEAK